MGHCGNDGAAFKITMSFGFCRGGFLTAVEHANKIWGEFVDAPGQFKEHYR
jgi:hypothetical protein